MTQTNINIKERRVGEYKVPDEVYNANWRDDVEAEAKEIDAIKRDFQFFEDEAGYDSRKVVIKDADRIKRFQVAARIRRMTLESMYKTA